MNNQQMKERERRRLKSHFPITPLHWVTRSLSLSPYFWLFAQFHLYMNVGLLAEHVHVDAAVQKWQ